MQVIHSSGGYADIMEEPLLNLHFLATKGIEITLKDRNRPSHTITITMSAEEWLSLVKSFIPIITDKG